MKLALRTKNKAVEPEVGEQAPISTQFVGAGPPVKKRNVGGVAASLLFITVGTLLLVYLFAGSDARDQVVGIQNAIADGQIIEEADLVQVDVALSARSDVIAWSDRGVLVGREASSALPAGAIPHSQSVQDPVDIPDGFGELGLHIDLGALPSQGLQRGDHVDIVINTSREAVMGAADVEVRTIHFGPEKAYMTVLIPEDAMVDVGAAAHVGDFRLLRTDQP